MLLVIWRIFPPEPAAFRNAGAEVLKEEWGAVKGYLRIENNGPQWIADQRIRTRAYTWSASAASILLTDSEGHLLQCSPIYESIGIDSPK